MPILPATTIKIFFENSGGAIEGEAWKFVTGGVWIKEAGSEARIFVPFDNMRFARITGRVNLNEHGWME